jgi:beta-carotene 3-hydroxylase
MQNIIAFFTGYIIMEFVAWFSHKYIMHGFLWVLHRDHHIRNEKNNSFFQRNDYFFIIFALPAMILIPSGLASGHIALFWAGLGITLYGFTYFLIHEVIIHHRIPHNLNITNRYMSSLIKAHLAHHSPRNKTEFMSFGLLVFPLRFMKKD